MIRLPSDELDPKLEATARLFAGDLEKFFLRYVFPKARRCSADIDDARSKIEELSEELQDQQSRLARRLELEEFEGLEFLLDKVLRTASFLAIPRFSRFANSLEAELVRTKVARAVVERLFPLIAQVFAWFDVAERAETWSGNFELWLVRELRRIADEEIIRAASSGRPTTDQRTQQIGDHVVSHLPPQQAAVGSRAPRSRSRSQSPRKVDPRKGMIARLKSEHCENSAELIAVLMDGEIEKMAQNDQEKFAPLDDWKKLAPHLRTWKEFIDLPRTHHLVRTYINKIPPLPSGISRKAS